MNTVSLWWNVAVALFLSVTGSLAFHALTACSDADIAARLTLVGLSFGYLVITVKDASARVGRFASVSAWLLLSVLLVVCNPVLWAWMGSYLLMLWLIRSLYRYQQLTFALVDAGLFLFAVAASIVSVRQTSSIFFMLWSFFLMQALHVFIPQTWPARRNKNSPSLQAERFEQAYRCASDALQRLP